AGEYAETKEKHEHLVTQLDDLRRALADLEQMVVELDELMKKKRERAFKQIRKEFARYFATLFDGGKADLIELYGEEASADGEDAVVAPKRRKQILMGIDIVACPPGKKIKSTQALSGGERTMTSIALVCAILNTNPSPFVVLDEVEAALDETNTLRLNRILHELSYHSQFVLITHNRATMHAADALYGVTMGESGVSQLVSVKLNEISHNM
ncbi:MAG: chromosome segregation protein SMC, partial [Candidatus Magasanikbacteria bacterium]|nr:chromosome segregation protein SMC [Candidatus Magasanikbacteria bacterium]